MRLNIDNENTIITLSGDRQYIIYHDQENLYCVNTGKVKNKFHYPDEILEIEKELKALTNKILELK